MSKLERIYVGCRPEWSDKRNLTKVSVGCVRLYFSYQTLVGFQCGTAMACRENEWGPTTGKHLNLIGFPRVSAAEFNRLYDETVNRVLQGKVAKVQVQPASLL